jgi:rubrerythrin
MAKEFMTTSEGTSLKDLVRTPIGTVGSFWCNSKTERNELQRLANGYAVRGKGKVTMKSYQVVEDEEVKYIIFVEVIEPSVKKIKRDGLKPKFLDMLDVWECPACLTTWQSNSRKFCSQCGVKFDWSEIE